MISTQTKLSLTFAGLMLGASAVYAQETPNETSWSSYTASEDCIKDSLAQVLADQAIIATQKYVFRGASIDGQTASDINFVVHVFRDPEETDYTITALTHNFATNLSHDFRPEDGNPLAVRNGVLAYEPGEYEIGINLESRNLSGQTQRISNGEFVESGYGPIEYDTEERLRYLDGLLRACNLTM